MHLHVKGAQHPAHLSSTPVGRAGTPVRRNTYFISANVRPIWIHTCSLRLPLSLCAVPHFYSRASSLSKQALHIHIRRARFQFAGLREARCHALADHSWSLPISVHTGPDPAALCTALSSLPLSGSLDRPLFTLPQLVSGPFALPLPSRAVKSVAWGPTKTRLQANSAYAPAKPVVRLAIPGPH